MIYYCEKDGIYKHSFPLQLTIEFLEKQDEECRLLKTLHMLHEVVAGEFPYCRQRDIPEKSEKKSYFDVLSLDGPRSHENGKSMNVHSPKKHQPPSKVDESASPKSGKRRHPKIKNMTIVVDEYSKFLYKEKHQQQVETRRKGRYRSIFADHPPGHGSLKC